MCVAALSMLALTACSSDEDKLVGEWRRTCSATEAYTANRLHSEDPDHPWMQSILFEKRKDGTREFTDFIYPIALSSSSNEYKITNKP